jgi:predicted nuclease with TOPRIM domain
VSSAGKGSNGGPIPASLDRLERAARDASIVVASWKRRALEAEDEVTRLRQSLEELASGGGMSEDTREEVRRLRAENSALHSRVVQARKRAVALLKRLDTLGLMP